MLATLVVHLFSSLITLFIYCVVHNMSEKSEKCPSQFPGAQCYTLILLILFVSQNSPKHKDI